VLLPVEQVQEVVVRKPPQCRRCGEALQGNDPEPLRHQVIEVPPPTPQVTEYQFASLGLCAVRAHDLWDTAGGRARQ
jgi:transposase